MPNTLYDKIWEAHVVAEEANRPAVLYVDLHLVHEVTSPQAFAGLRARGLGVRRRDRTFATMDHSTPTTSRSLPVADGEARAQLETLAKNCRDFGVPLFDLGSEKQGIVHVIGPELGLTQPGKTIVCGDSHTSTHGAFGALAFGIGTSEVEHVLATQCLLQEKAKTLLVMADGAIGPGVTAKDLILAVIARTGVGGATGHVIEYAGSAVRALDMEGRMTVCNMSIEAGARAGMIAPDDVTFAYLAGREHAPRGEAWDWAVARWKTLPTDEGARFDRSLAIDASALEPMITYGTNPGMGIPVSGRVPDDGALPAEQRAAFGKALEYMDLRPGEPILGKKVEVVFIGSCTNSRLEDLRAAAAVLRGRKVAKGVRTLVVPGSVAIKRAAEAEGLGEVFLAAGAEWREPGCSMCIAMNGDQLEPGQYAVSTSNRNFEGRQGKGGRTFLASPLTAAASAIAGAVADPEEARSAMTPFVPFESKLVPLLRDDIDTDQIIPARFLKGTEKRGLGAHLFADWRSRPGFPLLLPEAKGAAILLGGQNFGCGSSREHAAWALTDFGFRAIIARSFADIFRQNALKNGLLPVPLDPAAHAKVADAREKNPELPVRVDLAEGAVQLSGEAPLRFAIDPFARHCLLEGLDELGYVLSFADRIAEYEDAHGS